MAKNIYIGAEKKLQLLSELPVGSLVKDPNSTFLGKPIIWKIADINHEGYPSNSVTLITERSIAMRCFDAKEPNNIDNNRKSSGNNRYSVSNIRQWLNSDAEAGQWYSAQHSADQSPNSTSYVSSNVYSDDVGFLNGFSENFKNALINTNLTTALNTVDGGGSEIVTDKIFLASNTEVGLTNEKGVAEGSKLSIFSDNTSRIAYVTTEGLSDSNYGSNPANDTTAWFWWLRTQYASNSSYPRDINENGQLVFNTAYSGGCGVRPLCNIPSSVLVSTTTDDDGCYTLFQETGSIAKKAKKIYIGIENVARKVKKGYIGINGIAKMFYNGVRLVELLSDSTSNTSVLGYSRYSGSFNLAGLSRNEAIYTITIVNHMNVPDNAVAFWDVSKNADGTIIAWLVPHETVSGKYHFYIGSNDTIQLPSDSTYLFGGYYRAYSISGLELLNTSLVTNMTSMFTYLNYWSDDRTIEVTISGLDNWDTSNVTTMKNMFDYIARNTFKPVSIGDLSNWDVSNVTNMESMFNGCGTSAKPMNTIGDLKNWDTSNVTTMYGMFQGFAQYGNKTPEQTIGDITNWEVSKVISMSNMFYNAWANVSYTLDLRKWDVSSVTSYSNFDKGVESKILEPTFG